MKRNLQLKYDVDDDFIDELAQIAIDESKADNIDAAEDSSKELEFTVMIDPDKYEAVKAAIFFIIKKLFGNTTLSIENIGIDMETVDMDSVTQPKSNICVVFKMTRHDSLPVNLLGDEFVMLQRALSVLRDENISVKYKWNRETKQLGGVYFMGSSIERYRDVKQYFEFCLAYAGLDRAEYFFRNTRNIDMQVLMLENYFVNSGKQEMRKTKFNMPKKDVDVVLGYHPQTLISHRIFMGNVNIKVLDDYYRYRYSVAGICPKLFMNEKTAEKFACVYYNLYVAKDMEPMCFFNMVKIHNEMLDINKNIGEFILRQLMNKEQEKLAGKF